VCRLFCLLLLFARSCPPSLPPRPPPPPSPPVLCSLVRAWECGFLSACLPACLSVCLSVTLSLLRRRLSGRMSRCVGTSSPGRQTDRQPFGRHPRRPARTLCAGEEQVTAIVAATATKRRRNSSPSRGWVNGTVPLRRKIFACSCHRTPVFRPHATTHPTPGYEVLAASRVTKCSLRVGLRLLPN